ncbi:hypothetical protein A33O_14340 [Nitratireductor aquibiodomus RA22]|uniref:Uncharacterized protein n=1 Tax=Nitratireductor aquibiodomus RA22 TaxID=1189611 RepID=I5BW14_9HYPH|nr:hypothetical protein [Nitratireductor aquibiodomus]EIM73766.1 hypothetical protein A33O_14340 [Nitratireductor aquibiodomus RA22]
MVRLDSGQDREEESTSIFLDAWLTAKGQALRALAEHLFAAIQSAPSGRMRSPRRDAMERKRFVVQNIAANLAHLALSPSHMPGNVLAISTAKTKPTRYERADYPRRILGETLKDLEAAGFLIRHAYRFKQTTTTVEPTARFRGLLDRHGVRFADIGRDAGGETILLRARQPQEGRGDVRRRDRPSPKRLIQYADTEETMRLRAEVEVVNEMLNAAEIAYDGEPVGPIRLYRSFLLRSPEDPIAFNLLGRLLGGFWQTLDSKLRHRITIGGEDIADLDFSAMHPSMAYLKATGRLPDGDPYAIPGLEKHRDGAKQAMASLLSRAGPVRLLVPKLKAKLPEGWTAKRLVQAAGSRHPVIAHLFGSDYGVELMALESRILMAVLLDLAARGIPSLPLHDGIQTRVSDKEQALEAMRTASEQILGVALAVGEKPIWRPPEIALAA